MLNELSIRNFVLIDEARIRFEPGLNIVTGETGAGKSVMLGALNLILGERADVDLIRSDQEQAEIEGGFTGIGAVLARRLHHELGVAAEEGALILKRQFGRDGKSRCFANNSAITVGTMRTIGRYLVDLHGQHEHQALLDVPNHLEILDAYGQLTRWRDDYHTTYTEYTSAQQQLQALEERERVGRERQDLHEFQLKELRQARLQPQEDEELAGEINRLENAEKISGLANELFELVYQGDNSLTAQLGMVQRRLEELAAIDSTVAPQVQYNETAKVQLEELANFLDSYREKIEFDPDRLETLHQRLDLLQRLKKKYGGTITSALAQLAALEAQHETFGTISQTITQARAKIRELALVLGKKALALSEKRKQVAAAMSRLVVKGLAEVGMQGAQFTVQFNHAESADGVVTLGPQKVDVLPHGIDLVEFFISTNPGEKLKALVKTVSGGEISRLMLVLKSILLEAAAVPTMVFDEIDVGISGRIAQVVGEKLKKIAANHQVLCITHLPQIASLADAHYAVRKEQTSRRTTILVRKLDEHERVEEIANLLAGKNLTDASRQHAQELLKGNKR